ncbi:MAG: hypothetical protein ACC645_12650 [Pirellulales bacterium]
MRKALGIGCSVIGVLYVLGMLGCWGTRKAVQHEPEFYRRVLQVEPQRQVEAGDELEQTVLDLHNNTRLPGYWEACFTEEQINGWLASDLPDKFPNTLPAGVQDPRVVIEQGYARLACRYEHGSVLTVISLALEVHLTEEPNTLAFRVSRLRAGVVPVSFARFLDPIRDAARQGNLPVRWSETDGDPVALVTIPTEHEDYAHANIFLESVQLLDRAIHLAGRTEAEGGTERRREGG